MSEILAQFMLDGERIDFEPGQTILQAALAAGAAGYVVKHAAAAELVTAIRTVHAGNAVLASADTDVLDRALHRRGMPAIGAVGPSRDRAHHQVLGLFLDVATAPVDVHQLAALLDLRVLPYLRDLPRDAVALPLASGGPSSPASAAAEVFGPLVQQAADMGGARIDPDTVVSPESYRVALAAAGACAAAVDAVIRGRSAPPCAWCGRRATTPRRSAAWASACSTTRPSRRATRSNAGAGARC